MPQPRQRTYQLPKKWQIRKINKQRSSNKLAAASAYQRTQISGRRCCLLKRNLGMKGVGVSAAAAKLAM